MVCLAQLFANEPDEGHPCLFVLETGEKLKEISPHDVFAVVSRQSTRTQ